MNNRPFDEELIDGKYISPAEMKQKYPKGGYKIVGEVSKNSNDKPLKKNKHKGLLYETVGYVWNEENQGYLVIKQIAALPIVFTATIIVAAAFIIGVLIWAFAGKSNDPDIDPNASKYVSSNIIGTESMDSTKILMPGFDALSMYAGSDQLYVTLLNPASNPCYFQYDIILNQTGEVLFSTKLIPPGDVVTQIKLPRAFLKGEYPITIKINTYSLEDATQRLNAGQSKTKIVAYDKA